MLMFMYISSACICIILYESLLCGNKDYTKRTTTKNQQRQHESPVRQVMQGKGLLYQKKFICYFNTYLKHIFSEMSSDILRKCKI